MKTMLCLLALLPFLLYGQGYVSMSAAGSEKPKLHVVIELGYQYKWMVAGGEMIVPVTNDNGYPALFLGQAGIVLFRRKDWQLSPLLGYGYSLESNDKKSLNKWVWSYSLRLVHKALLIEGSVVDKHPFIGIGVIGFFKH